MSCLGVTRERIHSAVLFLPQQHAIDLATLNLEVSRTLRIDLPSYTTSKEKRIATPSRHRRASVDVNYYQTELEELKQKLHQV